MLYRSVYFVFILLLLFPDPIKAQEPKEILDAYTNKVLAVFQEIDFSQSNATVARELKQDLQKLAEELIDFDIVARMSIGHSWYSLNSSQQKKFIKLFKELIQNNYFSKIYKYLDQIKDYTKEDVQIKEQTLFSSRKAEVKSLIFYKDKEIPVNYRFLKLNKGWKVYDIYVEGVSLVQNYRTQFKEILVQKSPEELLEIMQNKINKGKGELNKGSTNRLHKLCFFGLCYQAKELEKE